MLALYGHEEAQGAGAVGQATCHGLKERTVLCEGEFMTMNDERLTMNEKE